eukprot:4476394-Pyramimonas_sp.AAC.1
MPCRGEGLDAHLRHGPPIIILALARLRLDLEPPGKARLDVRGPAWESRLGRASARALEARAKPRR